MSFTVSLSQEKDSLNVLYSNIWRPNLNWANADTITLKPVKDLKPQSLKYLKAEEPKDEDLFIFIKQKKYGEYIIFDPKNKIKHLNFSTCHVGETKRQITSFQLENNRIDINYFESPWDKPESKKDYTYSYNIIKWDKNSIVIIKQKA